MLLRIFWLHINKPIANGMMLIFYFASTTILLMDIIQDIENQKNLSHILSDALILICLFFSIFLFLKLNIPNKNIDKRYIKIFPLPESDTNLPSHFLLVNKEFDTWGFTETEKTVAKYILLGVSYAGIADLLDKSERTVRQQALSIYAKSGYKNRASFTGSFIDIFYEGI